MDKTIVVFGSYADSLLNFRGPLMETMVSCGYRVIACAPDISESIKNELAKMNIESRIISFKRTGMNPFLDFKGLKTLFFMFVECKPDILLSYTIKPVIYGSLIGKLAGVKRIYSMITGLGYVFIGNSVKHKIVGFIACILYKVSLRWNHRVFFQNPDDLDFFYSTKLLKNSNISPAVLINGSGVRLDHFAVAPLPEKISFLLIARLIKDKGIREYVEAARLIKERYGDISFRLVGMFDKEHPVSLTEQELQSWIDEGIINYKGQLDDVRPAINDSSVYVLPSYREGTPRTILEAMSMGRPIITTDVPGCRETVIDGENGILIPQKNISALFNAFEYFIKQPNCIEEMGKRSREIAQEKYDVNKVNSTILNNIQIKR